MKIVHICLNGTVTDGFSYQDNLLPKYHKELGNEVVVIASLYSLDSNAKLIKLSETAMKYENEYGITVYRIPNKFNTNDKSKFKRYINFIPILEQESPDIIFLHDFQLIDSKQVIRYMKKHKDVIIYADNHADYSNSARGWLSKNILHKIIWRHYARMLNPYVKKFYGVTPARVDFLTDLYKLPKNKCELLVMGADDDIIDSIDIEQVRRIKREAYGLSNQDFVLITGGKIDHNKPQTIDLMRIVNSLDDGKIRLLIFGSVDESLKIKFNAELSERVRYIGWKRSDEIYDEFACADLIVFPGLHSVLWEQAVGMGIPCLVSKIEGFNHVDLGGNCEFLNDITEDEIKEKILKCKKNIESMRINAQNKKGYFSYREIAKRSIEI